MRRRSRFPVALALGLCSLALASPASAVPPLMDRFHVEGTDFWTSCDGFDIIVNFEFDAAITEFYDTAGELVRVQGHFHGTGELVNTVTGKPETGSSPTMFIDNLKTGTFTVVGLGFHNNIPGQGIVAQRRGASRSTPRPAMCFSWADPIPASKESTGAQCWSRS
jgi:hypothetical protein